jgi:hypothetical protein
VLIFNAREHIGHKDVAFGSSMTVSTPPSSRILPGPHDVSQCRVERPIGRAKIYLSRNC